MNKLKTYAQEKYKWEQIQASKEDVHKEQDVCTECVHII